jgi:hypothetical protein
MRFTLLILLIGLAACASSTQPDPNSGGLSIASIQQSLGITIDEGALGDCLPTTFEGPTDGSENGAVTFDCSDSQKLVLARVDSSEQLSNTPEVISPGLVAWSDPGSGATIEVRGEGFDTEELIAIAEAIQVRSD